MATLTAQPCIPPHATIEGADFGRQDFRVGQCPGNESEDQRNAMKILYVAPKYDYGRRERGFSYEHYNFYDSLVKMGHDVTYFDSLTLLSRYGRKESSRRLCELVRADEPDLLFAVIFADELEQRAVRSITEESETVTMNWFTDDHWRFESFSRFWAPNFDWSITTSKGALERYKWIGYKNIIKSQWGCNQFIYRRLDLPRVYDVTFVGRPHGNRRRVIEELRVRGLPVKVWGVGWDSGRLEQEELIRVFNQSRINLGISNASVSPIEKRILTALPSSVQRWLARFPLKEHVRAIVDLVSSSGSGNGLEARRLDQIKSRNFEVPGCGGFLLSGLAENLGDYYKIGREVVCFGEVSDLADKAKYYLNHQEETEAIASAGYERTLKEHTYVHRFTEIFKHAGLRCPDASLVLEGKVETGSTVDVT